MANVSFACDICNVKMSGPESFQEHLLGKPHKKNKELKESPGATNTYFCDVCKTTCTGKIPWKIHLGGSKHKKNEHKIELGNTQESRPEEEASNTGLYPSLKEFQDLEEYKCTVCDISCTGIESLTAHLKGKKHVKQVKLLEFQKNNQEPPQTDSSDDGNGEMLNSDQDETIQDESGDISNTSDKENISIDTTECKVCNVPFTGPESYIQHLEGKKHLRKLKINSFQQDLSKNQENQNAERNEQPEMDKTGNSEILETVQDDGKEQDDEDLVQAVTQDQQVSEEEAEDNPEKSAEKKPKKNKLKTLFKKAKEQLAA